MGYLFQGPALTCFKCLTLIFLSHPYDFGDRVIVDGEYLTVEWIEIFTTVFRRWDGTAVYISNADLYGKKIYNVRRAGAQLDTIDLLFDKEKTTIEQVWGLRDKMVEFCKSEPLDYTGSVEIVGFEVDGNKLKAQLSFVHRTNFQEVSLRSSRRNKFMAMLKQVATELSISYFE